MRTKGWNHELLKLFHKLNETMDKISQLLTSLVVVKYKAFIPK